MGVSAADMPSPEEMVVSPPPPSADDERRVMLEQLRIPAAFKITTECLREISFGRTIARFQEHDLHLPKNDPVRQAYGELSKRSMHAANSFQDMHVLQTTRRSFRITLQAFENSAKRKRQAKTLKLAKKRTKSIILARERDFAAKQVASVNENMPSQTCMLCYQPLYLAKSIRDVDGKDKSVSINGAKKCRNPFCPERICSYTIRSRDTQAALAILVSGSHGSLSC
ncbi:hypothetical protein BGZ47_010870 [Haplosporangium gracile]|nr:hypothetical protein BGZ47_010870 [Haplosporangium gracile]